MNTERSDFKSRTTVRRTSIKSKTINPKLTKQKT